MGLLHGSREQECALTCPCQLYMSCRAHGVCQTSVYTPYVAWVWLSSCVEIVVHVLAGSRTWGVALQQQGFIQEGPKRCWILEHQIHWTYKCSQFSFSFLCMNGTWSFMVGNNYDNWSMHSYVCCLFLPCVWSAKYPWVMIDSNPVCRGIRATPLGLIVLDSILPDLIAAVELLAGHVILGTCRSMF